MQLEMGSTCLWRVVCGVPPQTFLGLTEPPNGEGGVGGRYQRRDAVGSTRDACAPHLQLNCYGLVGNGLVLPAPARFWHPGCKHLWLAYPVVVSPAAPKRPPAANPAGWTGHQKRLGRPHARPRLERARHPAEGGVNESPSPTCKKSITRPIANIS